MVLEQPIAKNKQNTCGPILLTTCRKNSKWITDLPVKSKTTKYLVEKKGENLCDFKLN